MNIEYLYNADPYIAANLGSASAPYYRVPPTGTMKFYRVKP
jgi:hypothetical protein